MRMEIGEVILYQFFFYFRIIFRISPFSRVMIVKPDSSYHVQIGRITIRAHGDSVRTVQQPLVLESD